MRHLSQAIKSHQNQEILYILATIKTTVTHYLGHPTYEKGLQDWFREVKFPMAFAVAFDMFYTHKNDSQKIKNNKHSDMMNEI